jgi:hypothetical protein
MQVLATLRDYNVLRTPQQFLKPPSSFKLICIGRFVGITERTSWDLEKF